MTLGKVSCKFRLLIFEEVANADILTSIFKENQFQRKNIDKQGCQLNEN